MNGIKLENVRINEKQWNRMPLLNVESKQIEIIPKSIRQLDLNKKHSHFAKSMKVM